MPVSFSRTFSKIFQRLLLKIKTATFFSTTSAIFLSGMKLLNGRELAGYIKERQAHQVRSLRQADGVAPRLAIIKTKDEDVINTYVRLKQNYGSDIGVEVDVHDEPQESLVELIAQLNDNPQIHGIIVQLPLDNPKQTSEILNLVDTAKDVDGLANGTLFDPATPTAIMWLLAGYNIDLAGKKFLVIGQGPLGGAPLTKMLQDSEYFVQVADRSTKDIIKLSQESDIIVSGTGTPSLITEEMITPGQVIIDAGVAVQSGKTVGDVDPAVYEHEELAAITPKKGGVGPLTVSALFENVLKAARDTIGDDEFDEE